MPTDAERLCKLQEQLASKRQWYETTWAELASLVLPRAYQFGGGKVAYGSLERELFDSTAPLALERFGAAMEQMLTPRSAVWHGIRAPRSAGPIGESWAAARYYEGVRDSLFDFRYGGRSAFASTLTEDYQGIGAFGTAGLYVESDPREVIKYKPVPLSDLWAEWDAWGRLLRVHHKLKLTGEALRREYPDAELPPAVVRKIEQQPFEPFEVLHVVEPNTGQDTSRGDFRGMALASWHVLAEGKTILRRSGYRTWPYIVGRYQVVAGEPYGRSPALMALADVRMLQQMSRTMIRRANWEAEPPWAAADDDLPTPPLLEPNAINPGMLSSDGKPKLAPLQPGGQYSIGLDMQEQRRRSINDAFLVTLFQILVEAPQMTATEVLQRAQEKGALLAPTMGRLQGEMLGPLIEREVDILAEAGQLPEMPDEVAQLGGIYEVEYTSPLAQMQRAEQGAAILRTWDGLAVPLSAGRVDVLDVFDLDAQTRRVAESFGVPAELMADPKAVEQQRQQRAEAAQAQAMADAAPGVARAAKDLTQAGQMANG